jgi:hypothetical protein
MRAALRRATCSCGEWTWANLSSLNVPILRQTVPFRTDANISRFREYPTRLMEEKMTHHFSFETTVVTAEGLALLENVLGRWCAEKRLDMRSPKAKAAARELVDLFHFGVRKEKELDHLLRHMH